MFGLNGLKRNLTVQTLTTLWLVIAMITAGAIYFQSRQTVVAMTEPNFKLPTARNPIPDLRPVPWVSLMPDNPGSPENWHHGIKATYFEAGSAPGPDDDGITNASSYWYDDWANHIGGIDDGSLDLVRTRMDNLYYFALPCREYDGVNGETLEPGSVTPAVELSPWYKGPEANRGDGMSWFKNQWIEVVAGQNHIFAQWADAGPLKHDAPSDCQYVFGRYDERPRMEPTGDNHSALDLSPTAFQKLGVDLNQGIVQVSWRFVVKPSDVPPGDWLANVTTSPPDWG